MKDQVQSDVNGKQYCCQVICGTVGAEGIVNEIGQGGGEKTCGVNDGDYVSVKVENERGTTFNNVKIRVDESFTLEMHIDTDEANASEIKQGDKVTVIK